MRMKYNFYLRSYFPNINLNINVLSNEMSLLTGFITKEKNLQILILLRRYFTIFFHSKNNVTNSLSSCKNIY